MKELKRRLSNPINYHSWIQYADKGGKGICQPDCFIELTNEIILIEVKLTGGWYGKLQMEGLYAPLLEHIFKKPVRCLLICRHYTDETPGPEFDSLEEFVIRGQPYGVWHWVL